MKKLRSIALALFATATISAQDLKTNEVPANLQTSFTKAYANATDVEWEKALENYKVEFEIDNMDHEIWYTADGKTVKTEIDILVSSIPAVISNAIKTKYPTYKVDSAEITEEGTKKTYTVEIKKGTNEERKLMLDASGSVLSDVAD